MAKLTGIALSVLLLSNIGFLTNVAEALSCPSPPPNYELVSEDYDERNINCHYAGYEGERWNQPRISMYGANDPHNVRTTCNHAGQKEISTYDTTVYSTTHAISVIYSHHFESIALEFLKQAEAENYGARCGSTGQDTSDDDQTTQDDDDIDLPSSQEYDSDSDGIYDSEDACPDDPEDYIGVEDGCPELELDNDNDGIANTDDACPSYAEDNLGVYDGCPGDSFEDADRDFIIDYLDKCPTEFESYGLGDGCPDRDLDGFRDSIDKCINLAEDFKGEFDGCPDIPIDTDSDGDTIPDYSDRCPYKTEDLRGEYDGCPEARIDSDGDGIDDYIDKCPYEPEDFIGIRSDGCPDPLLRDFLVELERQEREILANLGEITFKKGEVHQTIDSGSEVNIISETNIVKTGNEPDTNIKIQSDNGGVINLAENTKLRVIEVKPDDKKNNVDSELQRTQAALLAIFLLFDIDPMELLLASPLQSEREKESSLKFQELLDKYREEQKILKH